MIQTLFSFFMQKSAGQPSSLLYNRVEVISFVACVSFMEEFQMAIWRHISKQQNFLVRLRNYNKQHLILAKFGSSDPLLISQGCDTIIFEALHLHNVAVLIDTHTKIDPQA